MNELTLSNNLVQIELEIHRQKRPVEDLGAGWIIFQI